jgi:hypothetical protein
MGHAGGLAQTYAKASDEYRRAAIDKLEAFILAKIPEADTSIPNNWVN